MLSPEQIHRLEEIAREAARTAEPAHDFGHVRRVAASAQHIAEAEGADLDKARIWMSLSPQLYRKLLRLPATLHTETARAMAREHTGFIELFLEQLEREINPGQNGTGDNQV